MLFRSIANDAKRMRCGIAAGWFEDAGHLGGLSRRSRHSYTSQFLFLAHQFHAGVNEWLTIRNSVRGFFKWLPICRYDTGNGSGGRQPGCRVLEAISGNIGASRTIVAVVVFLPHGY